MNNINNIGEYKDKVLYILYSNDDTEYVVNKVIETAGKYFGVSRVYIFENAEDDNYFNNTFEWCNENISSQIESLQNVHYIEGLGEDYRDNFNEEGLFICADIKILPKELYDILKSQGIKSMLQCAIDSNGVFKGCIGFDICYSGYENWKDEPEKIEGLIYTARLLSIFLIQRRSMEILNHKTSKLRDAYKNIHSENKAKTDFLSRVSHDMRTPLNGILGLTELMKTTSDLELIKKYISQLEMSGKYLLNLINDTLDVSKIESGQMELNPIVCDGKNVFINTLGLLRPNVMEKDIAFNMHIAPLPFTTLYLDVGRLEQLIMNIVGNAIKFTPRGGTIDLYMDNVECKNGVIKDRITVKDSGIGISKEFLPHLFEPFSQEHNINTSKIKGTGLGMTISKQIVELMGGEISVKSEVGKGTEFTFTLDFPVATKEQIEASKVNAPDKIDLDVLSGTKILLFEDNELNAQITKELLKSKDIIVDWVRDGKEGVDKFANSTQYYYDLMLMDIRMPVMDGLEATRAIRALDRLDSSSIPIIALTANAYDDNRAMSKKVGMNTHLGKPIEPKLLYNTIYKYVYNKDK